MNSLSAVAVLHAMMNPFTDPWSVIRQLSCAQAASGLCRAGGLGIIADRSWPPAYEDQLRETKR